MSSLRWLIEEERRRNKDIKMENFQFECENWKLWKRGAREDEGVSLWFSLKEIDPR